MKNNRFSAKTDPAACISLIVIVIYIVLAFAAPFLTPYEYDRIDLANRFASFSAQHLLGTDELGRDVFTRLLYGSRISLSIGIFSTFLSAFIGVLLGMIAGFHKGITETVIMRVTDVVMSFPSILLMMVIVFTLGNSVLHMLVSIALVDWAGIARILYSRTLTIQKSGYVDVARGMGIGNARIIFRHILPNCLGEIIAVLTMNIPSAIIAESTLSFLGLGITIPVASWGTMVNMEKQFFYTKPSLCFLPSFAILTLVLAFHFLGKGLNKRFG